MFVSCSYSEYLFKVQTFLETETVSFLTYITYNVLTFEREDNRSTRRKTLEAQKRSTTGTQLT